MLAPCDLKIDLMVGTAGRYSENLWFNPTTACVRQHRGFRVVVWKTRLRNPAVTRSHYCLIYRPETAPVVIVERVVPSALAGCLVVIVHEALVLSLSFASHPALRNVSFQRLHDIARGFRLPS